MHLGRTTLKQNRECSGRNRRHLKNMPPTVVQPEAAEKPSSSDRPREHDISVQKTRYQCTKAQTGY